MAVRRTGLVAAAWHALVAAGCTLQPMPATVGVLVIICAVAINALTMNEVG